MLLKYEDGKRDALFECLHHLITYLGYFAGWPIMGITNLGYFDGWSIMGFVIPNWLYHLSAVGVIFLVSILVLK